MAKKFIASAIKHPGRIKNLAKRKGISTREAASEASGSSNKRLAAAGRLAQRFQKGGDLHQGGNQTLHPGDMKYSMTADRNANLACKNQFIKDRDYARAAVPEKIGSGPGRNDTFSICSGNEHNPGR